MAEGAVTAASCLVMPCTSLSAADFASYETGVAACAETCVVTAAGLTTGDAETVAALAVAHARSAAAKNVLTLRLL